MLGDDDLHVPNPWVRVEKTAWRQLTGALRVALETALDSCPVASPRVNFLCDSAELVREVSEFAGYQGFHIGEDESAIPGHATVVVHPPSRSPHALIQSAARAAGLTRSGGAMIFVTSVVDGPDTPALSISQVLESLQHASGGALHLDELRSIRWANERVHRGAVISLTLLSNENGSLHES